MKTKLLRKLRKKFKIIHYPNYGVNYSLLKIEGPKKSELEDWAYPTHFSCRIWKESAYIPRGEDKWDYLCRFINATNDLEEAVNSAKRYILFYAQIRYPKLGTRRKKLTGLQKINQQIYY